MKMETKAILTVEGHTPQVNLYLPPDVWKVLMDRLDSNKLTVVLRLAYEYQGELKLKEDESQ